MYLPTLLAVGHKSSMGHLLNDQIPHKSSMGHLFRRVSLFSYQVPHKSSMGHLFRCGSSILLLSVLTQVLYGSLVSVWIICSSLIGSHTSPLWVACFGVDHLFFFYQVSHKPSMGRLFQCEGAILIQNRARQVQ